MTSPALLSLDGFGVAFGERVILASVTLDFPKTGMTVLVGPSGSGKSTLVRTLAGLNDAQPSLRTWGSCVFRGATPDEKPALVIQQAKFLTASVRENLVSGLPERGRLARREQDEVILNLLRACKLEDLWDKLDRDAVSLPNGLKRCLSIARALSSRPSMLMVDEPTVGLTEAEAGRVVDLLKEEARQRAIVFITHHQGHARAAGGSTALLAGGRQIEHSATAAFFSEPETTHAARFVRTGTLALPSPMAKPEELAEDAEKPKTLPPQAHVVSRHSGPRGFYWLKPGQLGGLPRPGIIHDLSRDLDALLDIGVNVLVCLEETATIDPQLLLSRGILPHHLATADMSVPSLEETLALCRRIDTWLHERKVVALHCKAGLGRTGTMLACHLVFEGLSPVRAIERARQINPAWIQSDAQVAFLTDVHGAVLANRAHRADARS